MASRRLGLIVVAVLALALLLVALRDLRPPSTPGEEPGRAVGERRASAPSPVDDLSPVEPSPETVAPAYGSPEPWSPGEIGVGPRIESPASEVETRTVHGRIVSADGRPLVAPTVRILIDNGRNNHYRHEGTVRPDGTFEILGVPVAGITDPIKIDAGAQGFLEETCMVARAACEEGRIELVLLPPVTIRGRLVDEENRPVVGSRISYYHGPFVSVSTRSDEDGRFAFPSPVNRGLAAYLTHRNHPRGILRWPPVERDHDLGDVVVPTGRPVGGRVVGPDGKPASGMTVVLYNVDRFGREVGRTTTNAEGEFLFPGRGTGPYEVFVHAGDDADGQPLAARAIGLVPGHDPVTLTLHPMVRLRVRFLDAITREPATLVGPTSRIRRYGDPGDRVSPRQPRGHFTEVTFFLDAPGVYDLLMSSAFCLTERREEIRLVAGEDRTIDLDVRARRSR